MDECWLGQSGGSKQSTVTNMWKAVELLCCYRPRTNWTEARHRGMATPAGNDNPDSFVFGIATNDEALEIFVRVIGANLPESAGNPDLYVLVYLEAEGKGKELLGRSTTIWRSNTPSWHFACPATQVFGDSGVLHFQVMCESLGGWGESWCFGATSASLQSLRKVRKCQLTLKDAKEFKDFKGALNVEVLVTEPLAKRASAESHLRKDSNNSMILSQASTTPQTGASDPVQDTNETRSTASESEGESREPGSSVATAMLKHWRQSQNFNHAKMAQEFANRLQLNAKKPEGKFYAKVKDRFFAVIGQEAFLGGLLRKESTLAAASLELAWFESKAAYTEHHAPIGSIPLRDVQSCSRSSEDAKTSRVVVQTNGGPQLEVICENEVAERWARDLEHLVAMVKQ